MLYLHCGLPRTSTSTLQAVLADNRERLATALGTVFPERWWVATGMGMTHAGVIELLERYPRDAGSFDELGEFLADNADRNVLLTAENLTEWLLTAERQQAFLAFLAAAREMMPVTVVWTLRRIDEVVTSLSLRVRAVRGKPPAISEQLGGVTKLDALFRGMRQAAEAVDRAVYVRYESGGMHNLELLRAFGVTDPLLREMRDELQAAPRRNARLTYKQAAVLLNLEELSEIAGCKLDEMELRQAFYMGSLSFDDDRACELATGEAQRDLHERALEAAKRQGLDAYTEFFGGAKIEHTAPVALSCDAITEADLERVLSYLDQYDSPVT